MIPLLIALIMFSALGQVLWSFRRVGGILEYPFLVSWVYLFFVLTQVFVIWQDNSTDEYSIIRLLLMVLACQTAGFVGYIWYSKTPPKVDETCDILYLKIFAAASVMVGGFFYYKLLTLPEELRANSQWSGASVAFLFLSKPLFFGGMIALWVTLKNQDRVMMGIAIATLLVSLFAIVLGGRRGPMAEIVIAVSTILFFVKGWIVPRGIALAAIFLGVIFVNGAAIYRTSVYQGQMYGSQLATSEIPERIANGISAVADRADECILPAEALEVGNAIYYMDTISQNSEYDFGTGLWDLMVHRYVPAQIFGRDFKDGLRFGFIDVTLDRSSHRKITGSTITGFTDAFQAFGYFGAIYFFFSAMILRRLWDSASSGNFISQIAYGVLIRDGLEAVTHHSCYLFAGLVVVAAFVAVPIVFLRRISPKKAKSRPHLIAQSKGVTPFRHGWARR